LSVETAVPRQLLGVLAVSDSALPLVVLRAAARAAESLPAT
jgi:hypothetical protein